MRNPIYYILAALAAVGLLVAPYLIFHQAPIEPNMGFIQKIFYYHVPFAWAMLLSAIIAGIAGGVFVFAGRESAERLSAVAAELTVLFGVTVMTSGPLWGKKAWGHYWVWDARLTTLLLLFLTFIGAMLARRYAGPMGKRIAAGVSLFGAANVPLVYISVKLWKTNHPDSSVVMTLSPSMRAALWTSLAAITVVYVLVLWARVRVEHLSTQIDDLAIEIAERDLVPTEES